ncbi:hypothetical protein H4R20_003781 [Coemansia guatemalensis]|uniref:WD40 repeat-like protein n=1 Tax=Coemansia guatemalensis TaxID=2761395 RepID=A0A9W8LR35_9FUNG|nr:hypothetical protein H4R20_003781 [Coemansia guatemalensis]
MDTLHCRYLLSAGADTSVHLFDLDAYKQSSNGVRQIESAQHISRGSGHTRLIASIEWYPVDIGMFSTASFDHTLRVWDTSEMTEACQFDFECRVHSHKMSPTGAHALVAAASESAYVRLCDLRTGAFAQSLAAHQAGANAVAWSPTQPSVLVSGGNDGILKMWDIRQTRSHLHSFGNDAMHAHKGGLNGLLFTEDGQRIVSTGADRHVRVWDANTPQSPVNDIACDTDGLSNNGSSSNGTIGHSAVSSCEMALAAAADGVAGLEVLFRPCGDNTVSATDITSGRQFALLDGHFAPTMCAAWRSSHKELYTSGADGNVLVWCLPTRESFSKIQAQMRADCWSENEDSDT